MARNRLHRNEDDSAVFQDLQIQDIAGLDSGIPGERDSPSAICLHEH
jgi:hypothetical protein